MRNVLSWIKNLSLLSVSLIFCFCLLITGDWFLERTINAEIEQLTKNSEAAQFKKNRIRNEDIPLREKLIAEGFLPMVYPNLMDTLDVQFPLIAGLPLTNTYYCNEGYGFVRYQSDRFGFRNEDTLWDHNPKVIMIGDSFVQGACVSDEETLPRNISNEINASVVNLGIGGNSPSHYLTYAYLFIPKLKPKIVYLNFYPNDNGIRSKSVIERKYVDLDTEIFSESNLSFVDLSLFLDEGMRVIKFLRNTQQDTSKVQRVSLVQKAKNAFMRHSGLPTIKSIIGFNERFKKTEQAITKILDLCDNFSCKLIVSFIPNSEYFNPDPRADRYADKLNQLTHELGISFVDGREIINRQKGSQDFAIAGGHLSPLGYRKMAKKIAEATQTNFNGE
jgi:hypothetical protein